MRHRMARVVEEASCWEEILENKETLPDFPQQSLIAIFSHQHHQPANDMGTYYNL